MIIFPLHTYTSYIKQKRRLNSKRVHLEFFGETCISLTHKPFLARLCCSKVLAWRQFNRQLQKKASTAKVASPSNVKIDASYRCTKQSQRLSGHTVFVHMTSTVLNIIFFSSYLLTKKKLNAYCSVHWVNRNVCSHYKLIN